MSVLNWFLDLFKWAPLRINKPKPAPIPEPPIPGADQGAIIGLAMVTGRVVTAHATEDGGIHVYLAPKTFEPMTLKKIEDKLTPEKAMPEDKLAFLTAFEPWEREIWQDLHNAYHKGEYIEMLDDFCHEGLGLHSLNTTSEVEISICSHAERFPYVDLPDVNPHALLKVETDEWPQSAKDALKRLADHVYDHMIMKGQYGC